MSDFKLAQHPTFEGISGQLVLVILDGVGLYRGREEGYEGNAFDLANTPNLDRLFSETPIFLELKAHGTAVGLPSDKDMGNSEVGHNAIGAGRVFEQGAKLVSQAIADGEVFRGKVWRRLVDRVKEMGSSFHLIGLLSDGNVHSHIDHLEALIRGLVAEGVARIRIHPLADGRDVDPFSYHLYLERLEGILAEVSDGEIDARIASGGGRMRITMDRYEADWEMVRRGWLTHVAGQGRGFPSAAEAVRVLRQENRDIIDQDLPPFVIVDAEGEAVGAVADGDSVVFFNFRGDRAIEISRAFTERDFRAFERRPYPDVLYAGMMQYDGDLGIPPLFLVNPPAISRTLSEYLVHNGVDQLAVAETQKFGHVTYFWNGNNSEPFDPALEDWVEVKSENVPFDEKPEMKAREVCDVVVQDLQTRGHRFIRVNFANGDMVGHTGSLEAAVRAMEVVDECIGRLDQAAREAGATMVVTADHGNLDLMWEVDSTTGETKFDGNGRTITKTSHSLSPVPWCLVGALADRFTINRRVEVPGLGNIAATLLLLLGFEAPADYLPSLVEPVEVARDRRL
jgi:2,3-bisphosphoglycerate-independent phosphoglycerate mutase